MKKSHLEIAGNPSEIDSETDTVDEDAQDKLLKEEDIKPEKSDVTFDVIIGLGFLYVCERGKKASTIPLLKDSEAPRDSTSEKSNS